MFFEHLLSEKNFQDEQGAIHVVCGDFNLAVDPTVDAILDEPPPDSSRNLLLSWVAELNVVDAWRLHHPDIRTFSGPRPRRNRLDYVFISDEVVSSSYQTASYEPWDGSDHTAHQVEFSSWHHPTGPGFWRLPDSLLQIPQLREDIREEAKKLLSVLQVSNNPGIVWKSWKCRMKSYLKLCQRNLKSAANSELNLARQQLEECTDAVAREGDDEQASIDYYFAKKKYVESKEEWIKFRSGVGFEQAVTESERSSSFFFRPPRYVLRHTPFQSIKLADGTVSNDPADITRGFQEHWGNIFHLMMMLNSSFLNQ
ncbi:Transposon TX1 uncharacterized protein [Phytophthora citrophthora]|uniref:Transposon TX1 uncharacterized protein n=1 Tax=Phytophthora citrophthora TaxID=4793 RepID=A0AAD9LSW5_9STRA|nr:Transposon TX1 uncharacterized protein [Phytophthora citrophthora]